MKIFFLIIFLFAAGLAIVWGSASEYIFKLQYPRLIGFDYGILTKRDLILANENSLSFESFDESNSDTGEYWECFHKKFFKTNCSYHEPTNEQGSVFGVEIILDEVHHSYRIPHAVAFEVCDMWVNEIKLLLKDSNHLCIRGNYSGAENKSKKEYNWEFLSIKTQNGYFHYFDNDIELFNKASND